jgi:hypothetical protein
MKKIYVLTATLLLFSASSFAENPMQGERIAGRPSMGDNGIKGKVIIHAGVGLNLLSTNLTVRYALSAAYDGADYIPTFKQIPMINLGLDYGLGKKFSVGAAFGYQTAKGTYDHYGFKFIDTWTRIHMAVRGDYHIVAKENVGLYTGLKVGYNIYTVSTTLPDSPGYTKSDYIADLIKPSTISAQAHFGFSYFFSGVAGLNAEVGLGYGGPYIFALGATFKL